MSVALVLFVNEVTHNYRLVRDCLGSSLVSFITRYVSTLIKIFCDVEILKKKDNIFKKKRHFQNIFTM